MNEIVTFSIAGDKFDVQGADFLLLSFAEFNLLEQERPNVVAESVGAQCALEVVSSLDSASERVVYWLVKFSENSIR